MPIYEVPVSEVHRSYRRIVADSPEEAKAKVVEGEGDETFMEYSHTLDPDVWGPVEEAYPPREQMIEELQRFMDSLIRHAKFETFHQVFGEDAVYDEFIIDGLPDDIVKGMYERYWETD